MFLKALSLSRTQKNFASSMAEQRRWQLRGDRLLLLDNCITQEHGNDILVVIQVSIPINITQVPNLTQFSESNFDEYFLGYVWWQNSALWPESLEAVKETIGRIL